MISIHSFLLTPLWSARAQVLGRLLLSVRVLVKFLASVDLAVVYWIRTERRMTVILHDLVAQAGVNAPFFSPATVRARLALLHKGVEFQTKEITYHDLRFEGWKERLGVEKATGG